MQDLDRDVALDAALEGAVHPAHRADADQVLEPDLPGHLDAEVRVAIAGGTPLTRELRELDSGVPSRGQNSTSVS